VFLWPSPLTLSSSACGRTFGNSRCPTSHSQTAQTKEPHHICFPTSVSCRGGNAWLCQCLHFCHQGHSSTCDSLFILRTTTTYLLLKVLHAKESTASSQPLLGAQYHFQDIQDTNETRALRIIMHKCLPFKYIFWWSFSYPFKKNLYYCETCLILFYVPIDSSSVLTKTDPLQCLISLAFVWVHDWHVDCVTLSLKFPLVCKCTERLWSCSSMSLRRWLLCNRGHHSHLPN